MRTLLGFAMPALAALALSACVSMPVPTYQPSVDNSEAILKSAGAPLHVSSFTAADGVENESLSVRGSKLAPGSDDTYAGYLRNALISELSTTGRYDDASDLRLGGVLTGNALDGSGTRVGKATVAARFHVERDGTIVYDKTLQAGHEWQSSFIGAIAIPAAFDNYAATVQKLLNQLFNDPEFVQATARRPQ